MAEPISEKIIAKLPAPAEGNERHYFSGATLQGKKAPAGFYVCVTANNTKSFGVFYRRDGKPYYRTLGRWIYNDKGGTLTALQAILAARSLVDDVFNKGADPRPERTRHEQDGKQRKGETVNDVLDTYLDRYAKRKLRGALVIESTFARLVRPQIGDIAAHGLERRHIIDLLDKIEDENGPVMADRTLAYLSKAFVWNAVRDSKFNSPIIKGMTKVKAKERARDRILDDGEIRALWAALDQIPHPECYARYVRFLLHTGCRRNEASVMRWDEVDGEVWTIPAARTKNKADHDVPLTAVTRKLIGDRPADIAKHPFVFSTTDGELAFASMSRMQRILNKKLKEMPHWTLHDLRRTARTLMSRAGVDADIGERAIGHSIRGVRATYDRHRYELEKRMAFQKLDTEIKRILSPEPTKVISIAQRG